MNQSILSAFGATGEERVINALNAFKQGNGVLVLDDEDRENEGDLICAAEFATTENVNAMASLAKGLICMPMSKEMTKKLERTPIESLGMELQNIQQSIAGIYRIGEFLKEKEEIKQNFSSQYRQAIRDNCS